MSYSCYEISDSSGEPICGVHNTPLVERSWQSQISDRSGYTTVVLVCPISREQLRVVKSGREI
jgi:hypothetical protein